MKINKTVLALAFIMFAKESVQRACSKNGDCNVFAGDANCCGYYIYEFTSTNSTSFSCYATNSSQLASGLFACLKPTDSVSSLCAGRVVCTDTFKY
jgi:hypothetical protein